MQANHVPVAHRVDLIIVCVVNKWEGKRQGTEIAQRRTFSITPATKRGRPTGLAKWLNLNCFKSVNHIVVATVYNSGGKKKYRRKKVSGSRQAI